jgi:tRNA A-37 threonylcarbamoyl transferase component Bud32
MAELNVVVKYRSEPARFLFVLMCALLPFWAIASPLALIQFMTLVLQYPSTYSLFSIVSTVFGLLSFTFASLLALIAAEDNRIHITKDGIGFPLFLSSRLGLCRDRRWHELKNAGLTGPDTENEKQLLLGFGSGSVPLPLSHLSVEAQQQLLMAIELWAANCNRAPSLTSYQKQLQNQVLAIGAIGYTQIWEDELSRRFSATSFVPLEPGTKLQAGKIEIVRQLAFGGLSALYLAQYSGQELVVVKEAVIPDGAREKLRVQAEAQLSREAELLAKLDHPRITKVRDHLVEEGRHYLVLNYIPGQDLRQFVLQNGPLPEEQALDWASEIAALLAYLHGLATPVIHRDLTPENIVIDKSNSLKLIDFGASNLLIGTATGTVVGKQSYIPPEQLRGKAVIQSDIYAFGGTLYFLLTGEDPRPLTACSLADSNPEINEATCRFVLKCTCFEPKDRYQSAGEMLEALGELRAVTSGKAG